MSARPKYLTLAEAGEIARAKPETVRYWTSTGKLRSFKPGRHQLVREDDLIAFIEGGAQSTSTAPQLQSLAGGGR